MLNWHRVCNVGDCPEGASREFVVGDRIVALFHVDDAFFALDGVCPHQGGPLGKGQLCGHTLTCPWHGWQFDVRTGQHLTNRAVRHDGFELRVADDEIWVGIPTEERGT
ncbi:MAG: Rieske 2Fe-2S domain-containing protein [Planctomycetes bacterium]|nr:Rieske 2Fe-2S domain-containing protein [Planctomycetota bacterium]